FVFQAEDGIRDFHVTGVQTCALPIFGLHPINDPGLVDAVLAAIGAAGDETVEAPDGTSCTIREALATQDLNTPTRRLIEFYASRGSEERRVGKECQRRRTTERDEDTR